MPRLVIASSTAVLALASSVSGSPLTLEPLILIGEPYEGVPGTISSLVGGGLSRINNSGQWVSSVIPNDSDGQSLGRFVVAHDGVRLDPFMTIPFNEDFVIGPNPNGIGYSAAINNHGQIAMGISGPLYDSSGDIQGVGAMIAIDGDTVIRSGDQTPFNGTYSNHIGLTQYILNDQGHLLTNFDLFFNPFSGYETVIEFSPGESGYDQIVRRTPGMPLSDGYIVRDTSSANWGSFDFNNNGDTVLGLTVTESDLTARAAIVVNGVIRRMSGPIEGLSNASISLNTGWVAINDAGNFAYSGNVFRNGVEGYQRAVFRNESEVVWIDDGSDPLIADWTFSSLRYIHISDKGDIFWQPGLEDATGETLSALFLNNVVIATSDPNFTAEDVLYIEGWFSATVSDSGQWIIFDTPNGVFRTMIPGPSTTALFAVGLIASLRRRR